ncbi:MAG: cytochrome C oxidase subunit IV family protein [Deltaproteobacteria bacterium]|nr:cytochrome C oxidase subunit IV family protein [Deltaproteobacteria bacterium]
MSTSSHYKTSFYVILWVALLGLFLLSLFLGSAAPHFIFLLATIKAFLVLLYYMGLKQEPSYISAILIVGVFFMIVLFIGLIPDMVWIYGKIPS